MGALANLIPLVILFAFVGVAGWVGWQMYVWSSDLADKGVRTMEKKNVTFTKDGMKVGVKEVKDEDYADNIQKGVVNAWNNAQFPAYKSPVMGWMQDENKKQAAAKSGNVRSRKV